MATHRPSRAPGRLGHWRERVSPGTSARLVQPQQDGSGAARPSLRPGTAGGRETRSLCSAHSSAPRRLQQEQRARSSLSKQWAWDSASSHLRGQRPLRPGAEPQSAVPETRVRVCAQSGRRRPFALRCCCNGTDDGARLHPASRCPALSAPAPTLFFYRGPHLGCRKGVEPHQSCRHQLRPRLAAPRNPSPPGPRRSRPRCH